MMTLKDLQNVCLSNDEVKKSFYQNNHMYASDYFKSPISHSLHSTSKKWIRNVLVWLFIFSSGNKYINSLTMLGYTCFRIEIIKGNSVLFIEYPDFQIGDSTENYMLRSLGTPTAKSEGRIFFLVNESEN